MVNPKLKGRRLGSGATRTAYVYGKEKNNLVVKVANGFHGVEANWKEYLIYNWMQSSRKLERLPKVHDISSCGRYLVVERIEMLPECSDVIFAGQSVFPRWVSDLHIGNVGKRNGRLVVVDFANEDLYKLFK